MNQAAQWRRCNACKTAIQFGATYWICSVSTCNRKRTGLAFCSVSCWEVHLPGANHREAWALERTAPASAEQAETTSAGEDRPRRRIVASGPAKPEPGGDSNEVLIIASRLKDYVRASSGFNTSDRVLEPLSEIVRGVCEEAIRNARREGRRTILDRDIPTPPTPR